METTCMSVFGRLLTSLALVVASFATVRAQESKTLEEMSLEELLGTKIEVSSVTAQTIFTTPSSVSVVDQKMIRQYHLRTIGEAISLVAGVDVGRTYLKRNIPTIRGILQDHYANKVLVLINGVPSWNAVTGEASIDRINLHDVDRLEILKGPASVLYGTNAYAGAINIVLKKSPTQSVEARGAMGTAGVVAGGGNYSMATGDGSLSVFANSADETGTNFRFIDEKRVAGHLREYERGSNFTLGASYKSHSVLLNTYRFHESYLGVDPTFASGAGKDHVSNGFLGTYRFADELWKDVTVRYGITYDWTQRNLSRSADDNTRSNLKGFRLTNGVNVNYRLDEYFGAEFGAEFDHRKAQEYMNYNVSKDSVTATNDMNNRKVDEYSFSGQVSYTNAPFSVLAGSRFVKNKLFGNNISSRATVVYAFDERNSFKVIWGQSFRAPALFELYFRTSTNTVFGNTSLKPEKSSSLELAYLTSFGDMFIQALAYYSTYENKIFRVRRVPTSATDKSTIYTNVGDFNAKGVEVEAKYQNPAFLNAFVNYGFVKGSNGDDVDNSGHYNFKYVPQHTVAVGLAKEIVGFTLSSILNYQSKTKGPLTSIAGTGTLDLHVGYEFAYGSHVVRQDVSVKNVTDRQVLIPEYVRRTLNDVPSGFGRQIVYEISFML